MTYLEWKPNGSRLEIDKDFEIIVYPHREGWSYYAQGVGEMRAHYGGDLFETLEGAQLHAFTQLDTLRAQTAVFDRDGWHHEGDRAFRGDSTIFKTDQGYELTWSTDDLTYEGNFKTFESARRAAHFLETQVCDLIRSASLTSTEF